jgi:hypothetical protein
LEDFEIAQRINPFEAGEKFPDRLQVSKRIRR